MNKYPRKNFKFVPYGASTIDLSDGSFRKSVSNIIKKTRAQRVKDDARYDFNGLLKAGTKVRVNSQNTKRNYDEYEDQIGIVLNVASRTKSGALRYCIEFKDNTTLLVYCYDLRVIDEEERTDKEDT